MLSFITKMYLCYFWHNFFVLLPKKWSSLFFQILSFILKFLECHYYLIMLSGFIGDVIFKLYVQWWNYNIRLQLCFKIKLSTWFIVSWNIIDFLIGHCVLKGNFIIKLFNHGNIFSNSSQIVIMQNHTYDNICIGQNAFRNLVVLIIWQKSSSRFLLHS